MACKMGAGAGGNDQLSASLFDGSRGLGKLEGKTIAISERGLVILERHLAQPEFDQTPENAAMITRLRNALESGQRVSGGDASFYLHEVAEATIMDKLIKGGMTFDEAYGIAHQAALDKYGVSRFSVYHPDVIRAFRANFSRLYRVFWGIPE